MRIEQFLIALLLAGLVVFIGLAAMNSHVQNYGVTGVDSGIFNNTYNFLSGTRETQSNSLESNILRKAVEDDNIEDSLFDKGYSAIVGSYSSLTMLGNATHDALTKSGFADDTTSNLFPTIINTFLLIVGILFIVSIVYMVFRFMPR